MSMNSPQEAEESFFHAFNANDVEAVLAHYEAEGAFVQQDGQMVKGADGMRQMLTGFFAMKPRLMKRREGRIFENGDVALRMQGWTLNGTGADGSPVEMHGTGFDVVRRQADGSWKMILDNPWGVDVLGG